MNSNIAGNRKLALISDDDEFFRLALSRVLSTRLGFSEVVETDNFDDAVEQLSGRNDIEIALFDLNMPGMNNWQNLRTVRVSYPTVRVAVVSGSQLQKDILMALEIGLHGYISKGLGISELANALQSICGGAIYVPPFLPDLSIAEGNSAPPQDLLPHQQPDSSLLTDFTLRQREILKLLVDGKSNKAMARALDLSEGTIKFHLSAVFRVLGASNRVEAATSGARILDHNRV